MVSGSGSLKANPAMSLESDVSILRRVPLFSQFGDDQLKLLAFSAENRRIRDGFQLASIGERADSAYVITAGTFGLTAMRGGRQEVVHRLSVGEMIAELALIVETSHVLGAVALGDGAVIQIRRPIFRRVLDEYPDVALRLRDMIAERVIETSRQLDQVRALLAD